MPLELQIIRASEFIRQGAQGHFDLAASKLALAELARACRKRGIHRALMDLRALNPGPRPVFSRADLMVLVNTFRNVGFTRQDRLAILYQSDPHRRARLFAFLSTIHGWTVRAFSNFEDAFFWLSNGKDPEGRQRRSTLAKPMRVRDSRSWSSSVPVASLEVRQNDPGKRPKQTPCAAPPTTGTMPDPN